jgi:hypothetical protein
MKNKPYKDAENKWDQLTVGELKKMLIGIPDDYTVAYDSHAGSAMVGDLEIDSERKSISING